MPEILASLSFYPFDDGNEYKKPHAPSLLSGEGFTPAQHIYPVFCRHLHDWRYDAALEDFSTRVMPLVTYTIDEALGSMVIHNETADLYRYPDLTAQVESLCRWFESAVQTELVEELHTLRAMDDAKQTMRAVVDMPDHRENVFIRICMQSFAEGHGYRLSNAKRKLFAELTSDEISALELAVRTAFQPP